MPRTICDCWRRIEVVGVEKLYDVGINSYDFRVGIPSRSAILTSSAKDAAFIFSMT